MSGPSRHISTMAIATMGVYVVIVAGATTAVTEATAACTTWPTCNGQWLVPLNEPLLLLAWGHRVAAALVGLLVVWAAVQAWRVGTRRVQAALGLAVGLYPVQVALGALVAIQGPTVGLSALHLIIGIGIFSSLLAALAITLHHRPVRSTDDPIPPEARPASEPSGTTDGTPVGHPTRSTLLAYVRLMKPRLMWLLCLVAAAGMGLAAGNHLTLGTVIATLTGGVLAIGASGTFNHILERDIDRRMQRTADRPLATDQIGVRRAAVFGLVLAAASVTVFLSINLLAAALGFAAILYYSVVYTLLLKPHTVQNTVIGGFAGSFPALIGAAAASNTIGLPAMILAGVIFLWTPAHFYNLALAYKDDYQRGEFPMLPVVRGEAVTRLHIMGYLGATFIAVAILTAVADLGLLVAGTAVGFGGVFLWMVIDLQASATRRAALRSFHASNAYLGAILVAIIADTIVL